MNENLSEEQLIELLQLREEYDRKNFEEAKARREAEYISPYDASKIEQLLENSLRYKDSLSLPQKFAENENFVLGDQWGSITERTKNFPRPVLNICNYIVSHKTAQIQADNVRIVFSNHSGNQEIGELFSKFSDSEFERLKMTELNANILDDAAIKGLGIGYFYIEPSADGLVKIQREKIDPVNIHVSNPKEQDIQKMSWIIVLQRLPLDTIKKMAQEAGIDSNMIVADKEIRGSQYANKDVDIDGVEKANLINFFYRDTDDSIRIIKACNNVIVQRDMNLGIKKFPFAVMQWTNKTDDFYSKAEIDFIKPNQRQINTLMGLQLMNQQLAGFPKMWTKKGALKPNSVKNIPGEILVDNSQGNSLNFGWLQTPQLTSFATALQDNLMNVTKNLQGAHDVDTGSGKADNATAIMLLQKRSGVALDKLKRRYHQYLEDVALIWKEFFINNYTIDREFVYTDHQGNEQIAIFNASGINGDILNIKVDIGVSSLWSEEFTLNSLDKFLQMGLIDFKTYLKYIPVNIVPFKESLLKDMQLKEEQQAKEAQDYLLSLLSPQELELLNRMSPEQQQKVLYKMAQEQEALAMEPQRQQAPQIM